MKRLPVSPIPADTVDAIRQSIAAGKPREEVVAEMRSRGLFMTDSIRLTHQLYALTAIEAKIAVHYSQTWADCREANDALHDAAFAAAKEAGFEEIGDEEHASEERVALQATR